MAGTGNETNRFFTKAGKECWRLRWNRFSREYCCADVEKLQTRPYCRSQQAGSCRLLSFPKLMAQPRTRKKEIGKWKRSRHSRIFRILSSTRHERNGITSPSIWSVE